MEKKKENMMGAVFELDMVFELDILKRLAAYGPGVTLPTNYCCVKRNRHIS